VLQSTAEGPLRLTSPERAEALDVHWRVSDSWESLAAFIGSFGVARVHVHHTLGLPLNPHDLIERLGVPFDVTVHDYYSICPRVRLVRPGTGYCGGPEAGKCRDCLSRIPTGEVAEIGLWRARQSWMLTHADRVICPSLDAAGRMAAFVSGPRLVAALHDTLDHERFDGPWPPVPAPGEPLRVALLGVLSADKGAGLVGECARLAQQSGALVEFSLIGFVPRPDSRFVRGARLQSSGVYGADEVQSRLAATRPHVVWFPAAWPETYSYTLSEAMTARLPVVTPDLGAFTERTAGRPWSWSVPWNSAPADLVTLFGHIADELRRREWNGSANGPAGSAGESKLRYPVAATTVFYDAEYLAPLVRGLAEEPPAPRRAGKDGHA
jgi:glycosyltransferase involved in cell wall biosynthesis